jgi:hypothetical protein
MGGLYSRQKGKRGERLVRDLFIAHGFVSRRGQQFQGSPDSPDVVVPDLPWLHIESKFVEKLDLEKALEQAEKDAGEKFAVVFHKKSRQDWVVSMTVENFFELLIKAHDIEVHNANHTDHTDVSKEEAEAVSKEGGD